LILGAPIGVLLVSVVTLALDPANGIRAWWSLQGELTEARTELGLLLGQQQALESRISALEDDPFEIEKRAREDGGMMKPGERVLRCCD